VIAKFANTLAGQMKADRQIGERRNGKLDRVAEQHRTGRDDGRITAAEAQRAAGFRDDRRPLVAQRDLSRADGERAIAVGVRDPHPHSVAAKADARIHAQRMVVEPDNAFRRRRRRRPGSDPMSVARQGCPPFYGVLAEYCRRSCLDRNGF